MTELARYATRESAGRLFPEPVPHLRSEFQRDRDRIVHSAAFRRLEYKTQVFVNHEGDMFRTRLTHSIEVAQLARTVARVLNLNEDLTEAIALAHDLGHTPFGHAGQDALNECMRDHGGFEHNLQALRVVDELEERYIDFTGLNLTFETREGILKHCSKANARKLGALGKRFLKRGQPTLEAQVADIADAVAYNNHDVDDALRAGLIDAEMLRQTALYRQHHDMVVSEHPTINSRLSAYETIRRVIDAQVSDLVATSQSNLSKAAPMVVDDVRKHSRPLVTMSTEMREVHLELKGFLAEYVYKHYRVVRMTRKAQRIISELFEAFRADPKMLPPDALSKITADNDTTVERAIADYIAGMTDRFAISEYQRIFNPSELT